MVIEYILFRVNVLYAYVFHLYGIKTYLAKLFPVVCLVKSCLNSYLIIIVGIYVVHYSCLKHNALYKKIQVCKYIQ